MLLMAFILDYLGGTIFEIASIVMFYSALAIASVLPVLEIYKGIRKNKKLKVTCVALSMIPLFMIFATTILNWIIFSGIGSHRL